MKKLSLLTLLFLTLSTLILAQTPELLNYSAVARNNAGQPISNTNIGIKIEIRSGNANGSAVYTEQHTVATDAQGVFNLMIGSGTNTTGTFSSITWHDNTYYLAVGMDAAGGTNFTMLGSTQLLSVPYAMHAKTAESIVGGGSGGGSGSGHYIGESFAGGIIFHLWRDTSGIEHGLIVMGYPLDTAYVWSNYSTFPFGYNWPFQVSDGIHNSNCIVAPPIHTNSAAKLCLDATEGGLTDWYLPSIDELKLLWFNRFTLYQNYTFGEMRQMRFWSSTYDYNTQSPLAIDFDLGTIIPSNTSDLNAVRAIRKF